MKKKLLFIFLPILTLCLLTGCKSDIKCTTYGLPKETSFCFLAKDPKHSYPPENLKNTVIGDKSEDGWRYISEVGGTADAAKKVGSIKIAVYDREGNILKISPEFPLVIEGRNYYWSEIAYNYNENSIEGVKAAKIDNFIARWMFRLFLLDLIFMVILAIVYAGINARNYKRLPLKQLFLNIPNIGIITLWTIDTFCDYFNPPGYKPDTFWDLYFLFIIVVICENIFGVWKFFEYRKKAKEEKHQEKSSG